MGSTNKQEVCKQIKELDPDIAIVEISYSGSGDSFGDFYNIDAYDSDKKMIDIASHGALQSIIEDYCFEVFDMSGQPNFNDEGSEGTITIDVDNQVTKLDNYEVYRETRSTGIEYF